MTFVIGLLPASRGRGRLCLADAWLGTAGAQDVSAGRGALHPGSSSAPLELLGPAGELDPRRTRTDLQRPKQPRFPLFFQLKAVESSIYDQTTNE